MSFNPEESIHALCDDFQTLVDFASDEQDRSAKAVEAHLFKNLLKLGAGGEPVLRRSSLASATGSAASSWSW